ncbi:MAG TPA: CGNR zinc finger domain-containing protein [Actinomycetota bacterium]
MSEDPPRAPGDLEVVRRFANTIDVEDRRDDLVKDDDLSDASGLRAWLLDNGLIARRTQAAPEDLRHALALREAIRALALANHGEPTPASAGATLEATARRAGLTPRFPPGAEPALAPTARGVDAALGRLVAIVYGSMTGGTWDRLKICRADTCQWVFYDQSKNRSRAWCSMQICGNRQKARAFRERAAHG